MVSSTVRSIDVRSRSDGEVVAVDPHRWFEEVLPELAATRSHLAVPGARELDVGTFTVSTPEGDWTLGLDGDRVAVSRGDTGEAAIVLDAEQLSDLVNDLRTPMTFLTEGTLQQPRGDLGDALDWWVVLRSLVDAQPVHTPGSVAFRDRDGGPLDLNRSFAADDDPDAMGHFLSEAGFLHIEGLFSADEMDQVSADIDAALPHYSPDDGRSWWARTRAGAHRAVRLEWFDEHSPTTAALLDDDRLLRIGRLTGDGHSIRTVGNRIGALIKPIGVIEGISDVPWHKDCSLGRHSYGCSGLTIGISVTGADERSGQLAVVAGSHRTLVQPAFHRERWGLPVVDLPTATGDVTVHCSCTLHMSHPPIDRERRVMYTSLALPPFDPDAAAVRLARLADVRGAAHRVVDQAPAPAVPRR